MIAERATKAQVKLKFKTTSGATVTATRNLEVTVKPKGARSLTTLDCALVVNEKNGERSTRSTRVAELNTEIPRLLGVSKAILDSVIFCHQEESLWPMSEPGALKKRFDEIFEAQKYIKAIDHLKKMGKERKIRLVVARNDHGHLTDRKKAAADFRKRMEQLLIEMGQIDEKLASLSEKAQDAEENEFVAIKAASQFTDVIERLKSARSQKEWLQQRLQELKKDLQQRSEPDEALQEELDQFEHHLSLQKKHQTEQTDVYESLRDGIGRKIEEIGDKKIQAGKYGGQKADHERNVADRENAIKKSARDHDIRGYDTDLDIMQINEYMEKISRLSKDQTSRLDRLRIENERKQRDAQNALDKLRREQSGLEANRSSKKDQVTLNDQRLTAAHNELERFSVDEAQIASLRDKVKDVEATLKSARSQVSEKEFDSKLREANATVQQLEIQEISLTTEFRDASRRAADLAAVSVLKKNLKDTKRDLENKMNNYRNDFDHLLSGSWEVSNIEKSFVRVQKELKDKVAVAKRQYDGAARDVERTDDKIKSLSTSIASKEKEANCCAKAIHVKGGCEADEFLVELENARQSRDTRQSDVDNFMGMKKFFEDAIRMAERDKKCKLCRRGFKETKEIDAVVLNLKSQFSDQAQKTLQIELDEFTQDLVTLQEASFDHAIWLRLNETELPPLREELQTLITRRAQLALNVDKEEQIVADAEESQQEAEKLAPQVTAIVGHRNEESKLESELQQAAISEGITGSLRTIDDINTELEKIRSGTKEQRQAMSKLQGQEKLFREQISKHTVDLGEAKSSLNIANHQLESKASIQKQISEIKQSKQELRQSISVLDSQLGELIPQLQDRENELRRQRLEANEEERAVNEQSNRLSAEVRELMQLDYSISKYIKDGGPANLPRCQREIQVLEDEKVALEGKLKDVTLELNKIREEISNQDRVRRVIVDNLNYRKIRQDFMAIEQEIARLADQNAEADQQQHRLEAHRWQSIKDAANTERAGEMVRKKEKDNQYNVIENDLETHYKNVDQLFTKANIEVITLTKIIKDLVTYATALNNAIMEYHSTKMEQINRIIAELWTATYQGTDIDTICIRSEHESTVSNKSYNYRVTMIKQNVEMDMRGRCSAGQRVLASIIIRLALAECFSEYCGMIALDEPTTNLDRENIRSLAESLHEIINARKSQANFQLIVITHDEDFLKVMRPSDHADVYYRVHRNQRQKSEIMQQQMFEL